MDSKTKSMFTNIYKIDKFKTTFIPVDSEHFSIWSLINQDSYKSIDKIFIINPDPWEKKRHFKRRLINKEFIALMYKKIKNGGKVIVTTDSSSYFSSILEIIKSEEIDFEETVQKLLDKGDELYDISKYQKKGIEKGRKIHLVELKKI